MSELDSYLEAFSHFLKGGSSENLERYLHKSDNSRFLAIYRNGFLRSCIKALEANFPVASLAMGTSLFQVHARQYVDQSPPDDSRLLYYGEGFPQYLHQCEFVEIAELASLDRAWLMSLYSDRGTPLTPEKAQYFIQRQIDLSTLPIQLGPGVQWLPTPQNQFQKWLTLKEIDGAGRVSSQSVVIWNSEQGPQAKNLKEDESAFFAHMSNGETFAMALEKTCESYSECDVAALFSTLLQGGLLALSDSYLLEDVCPH